MPPPLYHGCCERYLPFRADLGSGTFTATEEGFPPPHSSFSFCFVVVFLFVSSGGCFAGECAYIPTPPRGFRRRGRSPSLSPSRCVFVVRVPLPFSFPLFVLLLSRVQLPAPGDAVSTFFFLSFVYACILFFFFPFFLGVGIRFILFWSLFFVFVFCLLSDFILFCFPAMVWRRVTFRALLILLLI